MILLALRVSDSALAVMMTTSTSKPVMMIVHLTSPIPERPSLHLRIFSLFLVLLLLLLLLLCVDAHLE